MTDTNTIPNDPRIAIALEWAGTQQDMANAATDEKEKSAHQSTMRALHKTAMEFCKGNYPRRVGAHSWLIESRTSANVVYSMDTLSERCTCANGRVCWHLSAAAVCQEAEAREWLAKIEAEAKADPLPQGARDLLALDALGEVDPATCDLIKPVVLDSHNPTEGDEGEVCFDDPPQSWAEEAAEWYSSLW